MHPPGAASREELLAQVSRYSWVHSIDLGGGVVTDGKWGPANPALLKVLDTIDLKRKRVLDIGCWDGLWSFEAEQRGAADVYATDDITQRSYKDDPTFLLAHRILNSRVRYYPNVNVYNLQPLGVRDFDVVFFFGVYYHLKHPLLALIRLRDVMKEGALLVVEGEVIENDEEVFARFHYRRPHRNDLSNWWVPTVACLREWIESSFFDIVGEYHPTTGDCLPPRAPGEQSAAGQRAQGGAAGLAQRILSGRASPMPPAETYSRRIVTARAVRRKDSHYLFPDPDLAPFDLTEYRY